MALKPARENCNMVQRLLLILVVVALSSCETIAGEDEDDDRDPASVSVSPSDTAVIIGDRLTLRAEVRDSSGRTLTRHIVGWSSSDNAVIAVEPSDTGARAGRVRAVGIGTATITAAILEVTDTARVTVSEVPAILAVA